jgi:hypothetical protein
MEVKGREEYQRVLRPFYPLGNVARHAPDPTQVAKIVRGVATIRP